MVVDQLTAYGLFVHPLCIMWEKLWRIHDKPNYLRLPARLPIGGCAQPQLWQPVCLPPERVTRAVPFATASVCACASGSAVCVGVRHTCV